MFTWNFFNLFLMPFISISQVLLKSGLDQKIRRIIFTCKTRLQLFPKRLNYLGVKEFHFQLLSISESCRNRHQTVSQTAPASPLLFALLFSVGVCRGEDVLQCVYMCVCACVCLWSLLLPAPGLREREPLSDPSLSCHISISFFVLSFPQVDMCACHGRVSECVCFCGQQSLSGNCAIHYCPLSFYL